MWISECSGNIAPMSVALHAMQVGHHAHSVLCNFICHISIHLWLFHISITQRVGLRQAPRLRAVPKGLRLPAPWIRIDLGTSFVLIATVLPPVDTGSGATAPAPLRNSYIHPNFATNFHFISYHLDEHFGAST